MFVIIYSEMSALLPILGEGGTYALLCFALSYFGMSLTVFIDSFEKKE
jgi:hypothetical protein